MRKLKPGAWMLERHAYAPELNQVHLYRKEGWTFIPMPGVRDIEVARARLVKGGHINA